MKTILVKGKIPTMVDDENYEYLNQWKWQLNNAGYVYRPKYSHYEGKRCVYKKVYMHRLVNETPDGYETDHVDRNPLNNQKHNLRTVTKSRNNLNRVAHKNNACGVKGVYWAKWTNKYHVRITIDKKVISLGYYHTLEEAATARKQGELRYAI